MEKKRLQICYACPLYSIKNGGICDSKIWINVNTGEVSKEKKDGYENGCGCKLKYKVNNPNSICPIGKW